MRSTLKTGQSYLVPGSEVIVRLPPDGPDAGGDIRGTVIKATGASRDGGHCIYAVRGMHWRWTGTSEWVVYCGVNPVIAREHVKGWKGRCPWGHKHDSDELADVDVEL